MQKKHKKQSEKTVLLFRCSEALVHLRLQTANFTPGPRRYARDHIGSRLSGEAFGRCVTLPPVYCAIWLSISKNGTRQRSQMSDSYGALLEHSLIFSFAAEDNMNIQLKDITVTARDGRVSHLDQVYIRGSHVRFFIVPDMLRYVIQRS